MISLEWVNDYIDIKDEDLNELAIKITKAGINIEKVITNHIDNVIVGEILEVEEHPNSEHLHICKVNTGKENIQIVCGAPNVKEGLKVIVALEGAVLPGGIEIKKSVIRGVESNGMLCALFELGLEEKTEENYKKGIAELDENAKVGVDAIKFLNLENTLYELDIHKHRNNDCYYHIGFAYEIAAILNKKVTHPITITNPIKENIQDFISLNVDTDKCSYYLAKMVKDIKIKESPDFIKRRLNAYGMRSINNVVDISNYVMLEYGQPLHFYDENTLGKEINVRNAKEDETLITLDGINRNLSKEDIVITDGKNIVGLAGIMGGENTEVTENTKNILIESAIFDSVSIRNTAQRLNLKSEASIRFGKGLNYEYTEKAIERACHLLEKYADAKVLSGTVKYDNINKKPNIVTFKTSEINSLLGITISLDDVKKELERLDFPYECEGEVFKVDIPKRRLDIDPNVNDIAEEIGRLYGYHNLVSTLPKCEIKKGEYKGDVKYRKIISKRLRSLGLNESKTYTLVSPKMALMFDYEKKEKAFLPNPMSIDKSILRTSLIPSLINVYDYNNSRNVKDIMLYEISKTYDKNFNEESKIALLMKGDYISSSWQNNVIKTDFYLIKGIVQNLLDYLGFKDRYVFEKAKIDDLHPGIGAKIKLDSEEIGIIGKVHPFIKKEEVFVAELSLNKLMKEIEPLKFKEASKYPDIIKDMAFIVKKDVPSNEISDIIKKEGGKLLSNIKVFDVYTGENVGENEKSIAYSLTFSNNERTLKEDEILILFNKIIEKVVETGAVLRDK